MEAEVEYNQPSAAPVPKVKAVAASGGVVTLIVIVLGLLGIEPPASLADDLTAVVAGVAAIVSMVNFVSAYLKKDKKPVSAVEQIEKKGKK